MNNLQQMFSIFDSKTGAFSAPFFANNSGVAIRMLEDTMRDNESTLSRHPADFTLVRVGTFDAQTGVVAAINHESLGSLVQFLPQPAAAGPLLKVMNGDR